MRRNVVFALLVAVAATVFGALPVPAQVSQMSVTIDGLACPFCVHGIEKKLGGIDGVSEVSVDLETGIAKLGLVGEKAPTLSDVRTAVEKAGFTPREVTATVVGTLASDNGSVFLHPRESEQTYLLLGRTPVAGTAQGGETRTRLRSLANKNALVSPSGVLRETAEGRPSLSVDTIEEL